MTRPAAFIFDIDPEYRQLFGEIGMRAVDVFVDPRVRVWRSLPDRENATLDHVRPTGEKVRFHVKRYPAHAGATADREIAGHRLLVNAGIPVAPIAAHGRLPDGRTFIILPDLTGYQPADKLVERGTDFEQILPATAALAARLHNARLHHRDLYLCHFMIRDTPAGFDAKLIDMARVAEMNNPLTRGRWVVKDLAQFWYSTTKLPVTDEQRDRWLSQYAAQRGIPIDRLPTQVRRKSDAIAGHDAVLNQTQPSRNISLPND